MESPLFPFGAESITLAAVGDLSLGDSPKMLGIGVRSATARRGGEYLFDNVRDALKADLVFGNLEGVLSDCGYDEDSFHHAQLRGLPSMAGVLKNVGFNLLNVANNHMMQYGPRPFLETCDALSSSGIHVVGRKGEAGWHCQPVVVTSKGVTIGFLGYSDTDNYGHEPLYAVNSIQDIQSDIKKLRCDVDTLIVSLHWGDEFIRAPSDLSRTYAMAMIESGVDIIIGHHPHVIQRIDRFKSGIICYSLGNFVSDMIWNGRTCEGLLVKFTVTKEFTDIINTDIVTINNDFSPINKKISTDMLNKYVSDDEALSYNMHAYQDAVNKYRKINRKLVHCYLIRNCTKYNFLMYLQIWLQSLKSLLKIKGSGSKCVETIIRS